VWLNVDQLGSGYGTPVALSSGSEFSPKPGRSLELIDLTGEAPVEVTGQGLGCLI